MNCVNCKEPVLHPYIEGAQTDKGEFVCGNCCVKLLRNKKGKEKLINLLHPEEKEKTNERKQTDKVGQRIKRKKIVRLVRVAM